jgi:hypothetical protein
MRRIQLATNMKAILGSFDIATYALVTILLGCSTAVVPVRGQLTTKSQSSPALDLTEKVPPSEQGYPGIPGQAWTGGGDRHAPDSSRYQLPFDVQIVSASARNPDEFIFEVLLRNTSKVDVDFPTSRNITAVEKPGNKSQRLFFFDVRPVAGKQDDAEHIGFAATGGSTSVPHSFTRLVPGGSLRVLLPASAEMLKRAFREPVDHVEARVVCHEWQLEDARYFIRASSVDAVSKNVIKFELRGGKPTALQP